MARIHSIMGDVLTSGLQGCSRSDEALKAALEMARDNDEAVLLVDDDGEWIVKPDGEVERAQSVKEVYGVVPEGEEDEDDDEGDDFQG